MINLCVILHRADATYIHTVHIIYSVQIQISIKTKTVVFKIKSNMFWVLYCAYNNDNVKVYQKF